MNVLPPSEVNIALSPPEMNYYLYISVRPLLQLRFSAGSQGGRPFARRGFQWRIEAAIVDATEIFFLGAAAIPIVK